ncbi:MAG TPA: CRISPR-associated helicase Cas3', partial [Ktedonobacterales bacterium]|nr:CRISPR-associated helicase Cas3' [Ktedonobacterales bacterium]
MTTLAMLRLLNQFKGSQTQLAPFTLMTATFSTHLLEELAKLLGAVVVRVPDEELPAIMKGRSRVVRQADEPMSAEAILAAHEAVRARTAGASLVVCNTVARAQDIYAQLRKELEQRGQLGQVRLELLHSRFTPEDRQEKSKRLESWLGPSNWVKTKDDADNEDNVGRYLGQDTIVVGTQVVEVGLNISVGVLHTELAPANSLIQRAGRCARFERQLGEVIVYPIPANENGNISYLPYDEKICHATWEALGGLTTEAQAPAGASGQPFGFSEEQKLIDAVHTAEDKRFLDTLTSSEGQTWRAVMDTLASHDRSKATSLIRDVDSVSVLVHPEPNDPDKGIRVKPFTWESFSLYPRSVMGIWNRLDQRRQDLGLDWTMKQLIAAGNVNSEEDNDREQPYTWDVITNAQQISGALRLVVPPELATYDRELGFRFLLGLDDRLPDTRWQSKQVTRDDKNKKNRTIRRQRSYVEHISGLASAYEWSVRRELAWVGSRLEAAFNLPAESLDEAIRLAIACHDIGKLSEAWQRWAHATQSELLRINKNPIYEVQPGREFLAKTDGLDGPNGWKDEQAIQQ